MKQWYKVEELVDNLVFISNDRQNTVIVNEFYNNKMLSDYQEICLDIETKAHNKLGQRYYGIVGAR